ncbi:MAG TPA: methylmalonyl Co-A mutase-associated GTPase MeaB [Anaerolineae bacterium]|nr:methylmalonyl Co-A mutase-associated GTPase MeaB [Anaerolineae bacterium]
MSLAQQVLSGNRRAIARLITLVENEDPAARQALAALYPHTGRAHIVGVTGAPGTGKSTLVNELAKAYRQRGKTVGIVAVDPTSPFSGGALLGDRVRMQELSGDPGVFIRSMATRGSLGGLAWATSDVVKVLDVAGYQTIFVETVGAGQSEVEIAEAAHTTIVVTTPGLGDEIQAIKAGILEIADIFAVNKADLEGADRAVAVLRMMLDLDPRPRNWRPPILKTVALRGEGVEPLIEAIEEHGAHLLASGQRRQRERERARGELMDILRHELMRGLLAGVDQAEIEALVERVVERQMDPFTAARALLEKEVRYGGG